MGLHHDDAIALATFIFWLLEIQKNYALQIELLTKFLLGCTLFEPTETKDNVMQKFVLDCRNLKVCKTKWWDVDDNDHLVSQESMAWDPSIYFHREFLNQESPNQTRPDAL